MYKETLRNSIINDDLEEFFKLAESLQNEDQSWHNQLIMLNSRFKNIQYLNRVGSLSIEDYTLEINRIKLSCLELVPELEAPMLLDEQSEPHFTSYLKQYPWLWWSLPIFLSIGLIYLDLNQTVAGKPEEKSNESNPKQDFFDSNNNTRTRVLPLTLSSKQNNIKLYGSKLIVNCDDASHQNLAFAKIEEALLSDNIHLVFENYANTIYCDVYIKSTPSQSSKGEPSTILNASLHAQVVQKNGSKCFSKLIEARNTQMSLTEADEQRAVGNLLFDLQQQLREALPSNCNNL